MLVPDTLAKSIELDPISFEAIRLDVVQPPPVLATEENEEKQSLLVWPICGRPHPNSPGEQLLAAAIQADDDLRNLFLPNQHVDSLDGHHFLADLLWREGRVIVEVDGYAWHRDQDSFSRDRQRDFELLVSGYLTLRLPHHEVVDDVAGAMHKIRRLVTFRRRQPFASGVS